MTDLYYYETKHLGRWCPCTSPEPPIYRNVCGTVRVVGQSGTVGPQIRVVAKVAPQDVRLPLDALRRRYGGQSE